MKFLFILIVVLLVVVVPVINACTSIEDEQCLQRFAEFKQQFHKNYKNQEEESKRYRVFVGNMLEAAKLQRDSPAATFGVTRFSDLTREEFRGQFLRLLEGGPESQTIVRSPPRPVRDTLPTTFTSPWVTPVKDQGQCGSCYAFTATQVVEGAWMKAGNTELILSPAQIAGCATDNCYGCDGGNTEKALEYVKSNGLMLETTFPYPAKTKINGTSPSCQSITGTTATINTVTSYTLDETANTGTDQILYQTSPLAIALNADQLQTYVSGVLQASACPSDASVDHAVLLVGWGVDSSSGLSYWLVKNSWSSDWGENGYFRIQRYKAACNMNVYPVYGAVSPAGPACTSTSCPDTTTCTNGVCVIIGCTPKSTATACGTKTCGTVSDGCGTALVCGTCASNQMCNSASGVCVDSSTWSNFYGTNSFSRANSGVITYSANSASTWQGYAWNSSGSMVSSDWTSFSFLAQASTGYIAIGQRLGQTTGASDGMYWKLSLPSSSVSFCLRYYSHDNCQSLGSVSGWSTSSTNNVTMVVYSSSGGYYSMLYINGKAFSNTWRGCDATYLPALGLAYIMAYGSYAMTFSSPSIATVTTVSVSVKSCISAGELQTRVAAMLGVTCTAVLGVRVTATSTATTTCAASTSTVSATSTATGVRFECTIGDTNAMSLLGYTAGATITSPVYSYQLATNFEEIAVSGAWPITFTAVAIAADAAVAGGAGGLGAGAIAGIVVGSVAGAVLLVGVVGVAAAATGVAIYKYKNKNSPESDQQTLPETVTPKKNPNPVRHSLYKIYAEKGVNVMNMEEMSAEHGSITARAPPVQV